MPPSLQIALGSTVAAVYDAEWGHLALPCCKPTNRLTELPAEAKALLFSLDSNTEYIAILAPVDGPILVLPR